MTPGEIILLIDVSCKEMRDHKHSYQVRGIWLRIWQDAWRFWFDLFPPL